MSESPDTPTPVEPKPKPFKPSDTGWLPVEVTTVATPPTPWIGAQPGVSNLNFGGPTYAWANSFTVGFGAGVNQGMFTIFVFNVPVHVVVDVFAYVQ